MDHHKQEMLLTIEALKALQQVVDKQKHTEKPTKRLATALQKLLPNWGVYFYVEYGTMRLAITPPGKGYNDRISLIWGHIENGQEVGWWGGLEQAIRRVNPTDTLERIEQEKVLYDKLTCINSEIAELQAKIASLREDANNAIKALPVPASSTMSAWYWNSPSIVLREKYINIWPASK